MRIIRRRRAARRHRRAFIFGIGLCVFLVNFFFVSSVRAGDIGLKMKGECISADLEMVPLKEIFEKISEAKGVWFRCDESLFNRKVSVFFKDLPLEKGLKRLLGPLNYCLLFSDSTKLVGVIILGSSGNTVRNQIIRSSQVSQRREAFQVIKNSPPPQNFDAKPIDATVVRNHPPPENPDSIPIDTTVVRNSSPP